MSDPFKITGPALVSFSGGRTSAYMLWRILQAHGGELPADVVVAFANTGKEMPQTLDFVKTCGDRWGVDVAWLEYRQAESPADRWHRVTYEAASRQGEPFAALIRQKQYLPNPVARFCTAELKVRTFRGLMRSLGYDEWLNVIGLRADEPRRVSRARGADVKEPWHNSMPLADAGITTADVHQFWRGQNFGLELPTVDGNTPLGNCDLCFLKSAAQLGAIMRQFPDRAAWWIAQESVVTTGSAAARFFRADRPSYAAMASAVRDQRGFDFGEADALNDCLCGETA